MCFFPSIFLFVATDQKVSRTIASDENCPPDNCPLDDYPPDNCLPENCPRGKLPPGKWPPQHKVPLENNCPHSIKLPSKSTMSEVRKIVYEYYN